MKHTPSLWSIILVIVLIVTLAPADQHILMWDPGLMPPGRTRQGRNPRRNRERWARRLAYRRRPLQAKANGEEAGQPSGRLAASKRDDGALWSVEQRRNSAETEADG